MGFDGFSLGHNRGPGTCGERKHNISQKAKLPISGTGWYWYWLISQKKQTLCLPLPEIFYWKHLGGL
jgi:hypothetical protein